MRLGVVAQKYRFSVSDYYKLVEVGILSEDDRVELINGEIIEMTPVGAKHASCINKLAFLFNLKLQGKALVSVQNPLHIDEYNEPQPDIMLLRYKENFYSDRHPIPQDVFLLIEVAESSIDYDRKVKLPLYVKAGISEVWIINLNENCIEIYRDPSKDEYQTQIKLKGEQRFSPISFPKVTLSVTEIIT
ncbi:MAG: Uma2 family endonuclease [Deltaproteobacteria bacterium]|nr:Uma2 family endonuclease [Deltaproteobacteria bacterium]